MLYDLTKRTARMLNLPLRLDGRSAPGPADAPKAFLRDTVAPELALLGATVVTLQLVYGFDGQNRCVTRKVYSDISFACIWTIVLFSAPAPSRRMS